MLITRSDDGYFGLTRKSSSTQYLPIIEATEEHWVTEDGHPVAPESLDLTSN